MARQFTWHPPTGNPIVLNDAAAGYRLQVEGTRGLSSPSYRFARSSYAWIDGSHLDAVSADEREVSLGIQVQAITEADFRTRWRALVRAFRPKAGDGVLRVADEAGRVRALSCRYVSGLEGDAAAEFAGNVGRAVVRLLASDPWFYGEQKNLSRNLGAGVPFFPIFPMRLSPSVLQGRFTVDLSDADTETYPVWTITGPGSSVTLTNETTGKVIKVNRALAPLERLIIDTRPGAQSVRLGNGINVRDALASDPAMWPLIEQVNVVTAALAGASNDSNIRGSYVPRYAGI